MHDLSLGVLFQMGAADSANLMDSPEASRLGVHRALVYDEEQGEFEKFRPYGPPTPEWLAWVREHDNPHQVKGVFMAARFMNDANLRRLDEIRAARDPDGTFREWMGRPDR